LRDRPQQLERLLGVDSLFGQQHALGLLDDGAAADRLRKAETDRNSSTLSIAAATCVLNPSAERTSASPMSSACR
jgi:hypothetical protein